MADTSAALTDKQLSEIEARQERRREHGIFGRIFDDLTLALAGLRAERVAREKLNADCSDRIGELLVDVAAERKRAEQAEEAVAVLHVVLRNTKDEVRRAINDTDAAINHPAVLAVMQRKKPPHG